MPVARAVSSPASEPGAALSGADRVLAALKRLAEYPQGVTLDDFARALDTPKSSTHRALAKLKRAGLAEQGADGRYHLGLELVRMAYAFSESRDVPRAVSPALEELALRFGETAHYAELREAEVVYVAKQRPLEGAVQMSSLVGGRNPAHATGVGKALLAPTLESRRDVERFVADHGPLERRTPGTLTTVDELDAVFREIRARGYATDDEENELGINCLAFSIYLGHSGQATGAISVAAFAHRTPLAALVERVDEMRDVIERHLGPGALPAAAR
jgi:IclR family transcriptional regulator, acetate operon repressor